jgi:hypothetical protein
LKKSNMKNSIALINQSSTRKSFISATSLSFYLPNHLKSCLNLLAYFSKNFIDKNNVFSNIGYDWSYVLSIFSLMQ